MVEEANDDKNRWFIIHGKIYNLPEVYKPYKHKGGFDPYKAFATMDLTAYFPPVSSACASMMSGSKLHCQLPGSTAPSHCHQPDLINDLEYVGDLALDWDDIDKSPLEDGRKTRFAYNGQVFDVATYIDQVPEDNLAKMPFGPRVDRIIRRSVGGDATKALSAIPPILVQCLSDQFRAGYLEVKTIGCIATDIVLYVSLVVILTVVIAKFVLAVGFAISMARRLGKIPRGNNKRNNNGGNGAGNNGGNNNTGHYNPNTLQPYNNSNSNNASGRSSSVSLSPLKSPSMQRSSRFSMAQNRVRPAPRPSIHASYLNTSASSRTSVSTNRASISTSHANTPMLLLDSTTSKDHMYSILLVTCYSEDEHGIKTTLDSLVNTDYDDRQKLLFVVADGVITGSGNSRSTPDILISMLEPADSPNAPAAWAGSELFEPYYFDSEGRPEAHSYLAIVDGEKRHNMARVYAGYYRSVEVDKKKAKKKKEKKKKGKEGDNEDDTQGEKEQEVQDPNAVVHRVPMIIVVKCGTPAEQGKPKPGNRGKRDSQIIIMSFLQKCLFDDRMTPLDFDLFYKITRITGVTPDHYELILMVDADTRVMPEALMSLVLAMRSDTNIMGLCGETRISNKSASWVTAIQVFEYYISHHLNKAFESIFGGVTCLPGCFCMYRIKAPKGAPGYWVPIIASPDIVDAYSENITDTLHKKNLLLLGEDRYLTTLMLKTFPKRKLLFVPQAVCKTFVPDTFRVLLSQRRRWINSTIHNLFELVLVRDLCGIFCCSMQFVIFMELAGTLVLPAAITFTGVLIVSTFVSTPQWIPLILLAAILGLPALLILFTSFKPMYIVWFLIYIISLPIWNFVLPVYAFWHFDNFSWGETRKLDGPVNAADDHGNAHGHFDNTAVYLKSWAEFEAERRAKVESYHTVVQGIMQPVRAPSSLRESTLASSTRQVETPARRTAAISLEEYTRPKK